MDEGARSDAKQPLQLDYGKAFKRPTVFIGGSQDVASEIGAAYRAVDEIRRTRFPNLHPYHWSEERFVDHARDWQDNIGRPADRRVELAIFFFRGRVGLELPNVAERLSSKAFAPLREFISAKRLLIGTERGAIPLTGTIFEVLEAMRAAETSRNGPKVIIYRFDPPAGAVGEDKQQQDWLAQFFETEWRNHPGWPDPIRPVGDIFENVRDQIHQALFDEQYTDFDAAFPGVEAFGAASRSAYFGRTNEAAGLVQDLVTAKATRSRSLITLRGPSGSGKSSLARAGVARIWTSNVAGSPRGCFAEYIAPLSEEDADALTLQGFVSELAHQFGCVELQAGAAGWDEKAEGEGAATLAIECLRKAFPGQPPLLVLDQAERLMLPADPITGGTPKDAKGRYMAMRPNWRPIIDFLDHFTRPGAGGSVILTVADDEGETRSSFNRLTKSAEFRHLEAVAATITRSVGPLSDDAVAEITRSCFRAVRLPVPDARLVQHIQRQFAETGRSPALLSALLREIGERVRKNTPARGLRPFSSKDIGAMPAMGRIVDELGEHAIDCFVRGQSQQSPEDSLESVEHMVRELFRNLLRVERVSYQDEDDPTRQGIRPQYTLRSHAFSEPTLALVRELEKVHLVHQVGRDRHALRHEIVIRHWGRGVAWLDEEYELAITRHDLSLAREAGAGTLGPAKALNALQTLSKWHSVEGALQEGDAERIDAECAALVPELEPRERTKVLGEALRSGCHNTIKQCMNPPPGLRINTWIDVNPPTMSPNRRAIGPSLLSVAARCQEWAAYRWLLSQGADPVLVDWTGWTALHELARGKHHVELEKLLQMPGRGERYRKSVDVPGGRNGVSPLHAVFSKTRTDEADDILADKTVAVLLHAGASVEQTSTFGRTAVHEAAQGGYARAFARMLKRAPSALMRTNIEGQTPLHMAAYFGNSAALAMLRMPPKTVRPFLDRALRARDSVGDVGGGGRTSLHSAARAGHIHAVRHLVELGAPLDAVDAEGATALMRAAWSGNIAVVDLLTERMKNAGIDIFGRDARGRNVLHHAACAGQRGALSAIIGRAGAAHIEDKDNAGRTPLLAALTVAMPGASEREGAISCARVLLNKGAQADAADVDGRTVMSWAAGQGALDIMDILRSKAPQTVNRPSKINRQPLHEAAEYGGSEAVAKLLSWGVDPGAAGSDRNTALHVASFAGRADCLSVLLGQSGAGSAGLVAALNAHGETALHSAADSDSLNCAELLLSAGAEPDLPNRHGRTPLSRAARNGSTELIRLLLDKGADPDKIDEDGQSALGQAIKSDNADAALMLVQVSSLPTLMRADTRHHSTHLHNLCFKGRLLTEDDRMTVAEAIVMRVAKLSGGAEKPLELMNAPDARGRSARFLARGAGLAELDRLFARSGAKLRAPAIEVARQYAADASTALKARTSFGGRIVEAADFAFNAILFVGLLLAWWWLP